METAIDAGNLHAFETRYKGVGYGVPTRWMPQ
jgi:hypothetical protein